MEYQSAPHPKALPQSPGAARLKARWIECNWPNEDVPADGSPGSSRYYFPETPGIRQSLKTAAPVQLWICAAWAGRLTHHRQADKHTKSRIFIQSARIGINMSLAYHPMLFLNIPEMSPNAPVRYNFTRMEKLKSSVQQMLGLSLTSRQISMFERYEQELLEWNERFNLTAIRDFDRDLEQTFSGFDHLFAGSQRSCSHSPDRYWHRGRFSRHSFENNSPQSAPDSG